MEARRFARSNNAFLFGVCAGLAEYIGVSPTLVRVLWALAVLIGWTLGPAIIGYVVLMFVMLPPEGTPSGERYNFRNFKGQNMAVACGVVLVCWGGYIIIKELIPYDVDRYLFPAGLVVAGLLLLSFAFGSRKKP